MSKLNQKHIYLVEDDVELAKAIKLTLESENYRCTICTTKEDFFQNVQKNMKIWKSPGTQYPLIIYNHIQTSQHLLSASQPESQLCC